MIATAIVKDHRRVPMIATVTAQIHHCPVPMIVTAIDKDHLRVLVIVTAIDKDHRRVQVIVTAIVKDHLRVPMIVTAIVKDHLRVSEIVTVVRDRVVRRAGLDRTETIGINVPDKWRMRGNEPQADRVFPHLSGNTSRQRQKLQIFRSISAVMVDTGHRDGTHAIHTLGIPIGFRPIAGGIDRRGTILGSGSRGISHIVY
jgi:hypothetical protein